jgi:hypothetical protein
MTRWLTAALVCSLWLASSAEAATVQVTQPSGLIGQPQNTLGSTFLYVTNSLDTDIGGLRLLVGQFAGNDIASFTPDPANSGISAANTHHLVDPVSPYTFDELVIANLPGQAIAPAHTTTLLGTIHLVDPYGYVGPVLVPGETEIPGLGPAFIASLLDVAGNPIAATKIELLPGNGSAFSSSGIQYTIPEPAAVTLAAAGLACLLAGARARRPLPVA